MLEAIGRASITTRSEVSDVPQVFDGVPLRAVLDRVGAKGKAMRATALNDYVSMVPLEDLQFEPIIAMRVDNRLLRFATRAPCGSSIREMPTKSFRTHVTMLDGSGSSVS